MASVLDRLRGRDTISRAPSMFSHLGQPYPLDAFPSAGTLDGSPVEVSTDSFSATARSLGRSSLITSAVTARSLVLSQVQFKYRPLAGPGRLFGNPSLLPLEKPGADYTRYTMMTRIEQDVAYHGTTYVRRLPDGRLRRLRPDWMHLVIGSNERPDHARLGADAEILYYVYKPGGRHSDHGAQALMPSEVMMWAPEPHPLSSFIGEAWISAIWREVAADMQATDHVSKFFENAATANMVVKPPEAVSTPTQFNEWVDAFEGAHAGSTNAWKTVYVQAGSDVQVVGSQIGDLKMAELQGGFETRVSARSRVPATVLLIREGLSGSALNAGNYAQTRRLWADSWFTPYAQGLCAAFEPIVDVPADAELTFDPDRVLLLQEDQKDAADIRSADAVTMRQLVDAGWKADAVVEYVRNGGDLSKLLGHHTGLPSVQVQQAPVPAATAAPSATPSEEAP